MSQANDAAVGGENIEKIRDILFGAQMRDTDKRLARIEDRFAQGLAALRQETVGRFDALEAYLKGEVKSLVERIKAEQGERAVADKELNASLAALGKALEARAAEIDERLAAAQGELRQQILEQSKTLRDEVRAARTALQDGIDAAAGELRADKVDRTALADLFNELALRLTSQVPPSGQ